MKAFSLIKNNVLPIFALAIACAVVAILAVVVATPIYLTSHGPYTTTQHTIYVTGTTVLATILTSLISSQVQELLLRRVDKALPEASELKLLSRRWRVILKIANLVESVPHLGIVITYLVSGLITTTIVSGLTPNLRTRSFSYHPKVSHGPSPCAGVYPLADVLIDGRQYSWDLGKGSAFFIPANAGGCPTRNATVLAGDINPLNPSAFAYDDAGVAVLASAVGTPFSIYSTQSDTAPEFNSLLKSYGSSVVSTTQCVPVMARNPITCHRGGSVTLEERRMYVRSSDGLCSWEADYIGLNPFSRNAMASGMCAHGQVGQGTIVLAATKHYIQWLAGALGNTTNIPEASNGSSYAVTCTVDTRDVWEYRKVTLNLQNSDNSGSTFARSLAGHESCSPAPGTNAIDDILIATAAAANWQILNQNIFWDGLLDLLFDLTLDNRPPPYAFNNSANALEDVLGLIGAIVASRIESTTKVAVQGTAVITSTTIGSGRVYAYIYLVPPAITALVLCYLMATNPTSKVECSTSKLDDLVEYGRSQRNKSTP